MKQSTKQSTKRRITCTISRQTSTNLLKETRGHPISGTITKGQEYVEV